MEFWPEDNQNHDPKPKRKGKGKEKVTVPLPGISFLETGRLEAVTLVDNKSQFEWTSPLHALRDLKLTPGSSVEVFKPSRPPALAIPSTSTVHRAEQGANFLRTYFPDIEIAAELVREELSADALVTRELEKYDPMSKNILEPFHIATEDAPTFLAFPMGETSCDLNISPLTNHENKACVLEPSVKPVKTFSTPILQLASSDGLNNFLAARTFGSTNILQAHISDDLNLSFSESAVVTRDDLGQRPPVDIKFHSRQSDMLIANDIGMVYRHNLENRATSLVFSGNPDPDSSDKFWQLALAGDSENGCLLSSGKAVQELDFRKPDVSLNLFNIVNAESLTCIEDSGSDYLICLASTERVLWLDRRFPGRPLFGIKHRRNYDRTLTVHTLNLGNRHHSVMTSHKNKLVTVYDVSRSTGQLLHMDNAPYSFSFESPESRCLGEAFVIREDQLKMFRISERGRICCTDLEYHATSHSRTVQMPIDMSRSDEMLADIGPLGARESSETNMRPAYEQLFPSVDDIDAQEEEASEAVDDLLEQLPFFWQTDETPMEQMLTSYDILFRAGDEPNHPSRADVLTETVFNSTRGYQILSQDQLPIEKLKDGASWHSNIAPIIGHFDATTLGDVTKIAKRLRNFDLSPNPDTPQQALRRQKKAREQLALDLTLAKDIFSPIPFSQSPVTDEIRASTSFIPFHYLQPMYKRDDYYSRDEQLDDNFPLGVRLLLEDWDVGGDPEKYVVHDPFAVPTDLGLEARPQKKELARSRATPPPSSLHPQLPPSILPRTVLPPRVLGVESQLTQPEEGETQSLMISTQVLPGPFGGRPTADGRKKQAKKRMGGF